MPRRMQWIGKHQSDTLTPLPSPGRLIPIVPTAEIDLRHLPRPTAAAASVVSTVPGEAGLNARHAPASAPWPAQGPNGTRSARRRRHRRCSESQVVATPAARSRIKLAELETVPAPSSLPDTGSRKAILFLPLASINSNLHRAAAWRRSTGCARAGKVIIPPLAAHILMPVRSDRRTAARHTRSDAASPPAAHQVV